MKKLLSLVLATTIALTSVNIQASNITKKVWAYTKIIAGCLFLIKGVTSKIHIVHSYKVGNKTVYSQIGPQDMKAELATIGNEHLQAFNDIISPFWKIPLGIFAIKSGQQDLKKLRKKASKQKTHKNNPVEAI